MKNLITLLAIAICTLCVVKTNAQNYYYAVMIGDTVQLTVTNANGTIQWQQTDDTLGTYANISGATTNPYIHLTQSSATGKKFYRAEITNPSICSTPWFSSIIKHKIITATTDLQIGDFYGGGFVFYNNAGSGLIAAPSDQSTSAQWGCTGTEITGTYTSLDSGLANTNLIVAFHNGLPNYYGNPTQCSVNNDGSVAAKICADYTDGIYSDWFLPSKDELNLLYTNLHLSGLGNFSSGYYWSSSEYDAQLAWLQIFGGGSQVYSYKNYLFYVRSIRAFSPPPPIPNCGTVTDYDGNIYNTVTIGTQCWLRENLKTTHYADGTPLVDGTSAGNINFNYTTKYYFWLNNDSATYSNTYGALYTWAAVMNSAVSTNAVPSNVQGVCPTGWHLPSNAEWNIMEKYLDSEVDTTIMGATGIDIGGKLKETGTAHWNSPNTGATNSSGFTALPGSIRSGEGTFGTVGNAGYWWTATVIDADFAWGHGPSYNIAFIDRNNFLKSSGFSVRCIKD